MELNLTPTLGTSPSRADDLKLRPRTFKYINKKHRTVMRRLIRKQANNSNLLKKTAEAYTAAQQFAARDPLMPEARLRETMSAALPCLFDELG